MKPGAALGGVPPERPDLVSSDLQGGPIGLATALEVVDSRWHTTENLATRVSVGALHLVRPGEFIALSDEVTGYRRGHLAVLIPERPGGFEPAADWLVTSSELVGRPLGLAVVVRPSCQRPDPKTARGIERVMRACRDSVACHTTVILGQGFLASMVISFISRVMVQTRHHDTPRAIHTEMEAAAVWIASQLGDIDPAEVADILATAAA